jgi:hypothetical protein
VQPGANEGVVGERANESIEGGRDGARAETSMRGASAAEIAGDDTEAETNVSVEALTTDVATALEV